MALIDAMANIRYWIVLGLAFGLLIGDIGDLVPTLTTIALMAMMTISLMGLDFSRKDMIEKKKGILMAVFCCFGVACVVTLGIGTFFDQPLWSGWVLIASVPCAISVVSATFILKGDLKLALLSVTLIYVLAIVITPVMTGVFLGDAVSPTEILKYVLLFILVPLVLSSLLKKVTMSANSRNIMINVCFFFLIFFAFGSNRDFIFGSPDLIGAVALACIVRIVAVHLIMEFILKRVGMERGTRIVLILMSIWKNSALAMTLAMLLIPEAEAAIPGALSLPMEMIYFMFMMWYYTKKAPPETYDGVHQTNVTNG